MNRRGFTLLEVLISSVILLAIMAAAFTITQSGNRLFAVGVQQGEANVKVDQVLDEIATELRGAFVWDVYDQDEDYDGPVTGAPSVGSMIIYQTPVVIDPASEIWWDTDAGGNVSIVWGAGDWRDYAWRIAFIPREDAAHPGGLYNELAEQIDINGDGQIQNLTYCVGILRKDLLHPTMLPSVTNPTEAWRDTSTAGVNYIPGFSKILASGVILTHRDDTPTQDVFYFPGDVRSGGGDLDGHGTAQLAYREEKDILAEPNTNLLPLDPAKASDDEQYDPIFRRYGTLGSNPDPDGTGNILRVELWILRFARSERQALLSHGEVDIMVRHQ